MTNIPERTLEYAALIDRYANELTPYAADDAVTKAEVRLIVARLARDVVHWTNNYESQVRAQVDAMLDQKGL